MRSRLRPLIERNKHTSKSESDTGNAAPFPFRHLSNRYIRLRQGHSLSLFLLYLSREPVALPPPGNPVLLFMQRKSLLCVLNLLAPTPFFHLLTFAWFSISDSLSLQLFSYPRLFSLLHFATSALPFPSPLISRWVSSTSFSFLAFLFSFPPLLSPSFCFLYSFSFFPSPLLPRLLSFPSFVLPLHLSLSPPSSPPL